MIARPHQLKEQERQDSGPLGAADSHRHIHAAHISSEQVSLPGVVAQADDRGRALFASARVKVRDRLPLRRRPVTWSHRTIGKTIRNVRLADQLRGPKRGEPYYCISERGRSAGSPMPLMPMDAINTAQVFPARKAASSLRRAAAATGTLEAVIDPIEARPFALAMMLERSIRPLPAGAGTVLRGRGINPPNAQLIGVRDTKEHCSRCQARTGADARATR